jgi:xanthine dehydrogenase YagT iron-sulfur-binding subunit
VRLTVNGEPLGLTVAPDETLLAVLRARLALTGTKLVCGRGECGACTVHVDDEPTYSCLTLAAACDGSAIRTIEGVADGEALHPVQRAFVEHDALQCGMCTSGQIMSALALLARDPDPSEEAVRRGMSGNLCRCGAYPKIVTAVLDAARRVRNGDGR